MKNINRFLVLGLIAAAALFTTGMVSTVGVQQAYAAQNNDCHDNVVGVCANVCANVNVLAKQRGSQRD
jgi:predicted patatin/cPLA2 family phospholipase